MLAMMVSLLSGCGKDKEEAKGDPGPEEYQFGDETVLALGATVEEFPVSGSYEESQVTYTYRGLSSGKMACIGYINALTETDEEDSEESEAFTVVDEELYVTTADLTAEEGTVYLARNATKEDEEEAEDQSDEEDEDSDEDTENSEGSEDAEDSAETATEEVTEETPVVNKVCLLQLDWTAETCTVTLRIQEGVIQERPVETESETGSSGMTLSSAMDYMKSLTPSDIGLDGSSMDEYQIYALDGIIMVDGNACLHLKVYSTNNPEKTNHLEGNYLLTGDKQHMYSLDEVNGVVTVIY
jgi:hypothetical protein